MTGPKIHNPEESNRRRRFKYPPLVKLPAERKLWRDLVTSLEDEGMHDPLDRFLLEQFVVCYFRWQECEQQIAESGLAFPAGDDGSGKPTGFIYSPYYVISNKMLDHLRKLAGELGLSPSARRRLMGDGGTATPATYGGLLAFAASRGS